MARIAFAWELGGELGHANACSSLAQTLALRGHRIAFMFSSLAPVQYLRGTDGFDIFQAPSGMTNSPKPLPASFADILVGCGYESADTLAPMANGWRKLLEDWKPDVVIADYAPTALLAARALGIPRITFGNGFAVPPALSPMPSFRFDEPVAPGHVERADAHARDSVNAVLEIWGAKPLENLAQLFDCDEHFLCTFPELDHYGTRPVSGYWGPRFQVSSGARIAWPAGPGKRIIVYLKTSLAQLDAVIDLLAASHHRIAAFIPGLDETRRAKLAGARRQVSAEPMRLEPLLEDCDLVVSHGGDLTVGLLTRGIPQLVFPLQYEQYITAKRVEQMGCGLWIGTSAGRDQVATAIAALFGDPKYMQAARAFSKRYAAFSPQEQRRRMAARIEQVAAGGSSHAPILPATLSKE